jgi:hypothetical protein
MLDRRAPVLKILMAVLDELVKARVLYPPQVGIIDTRRAVEEVPQPPLVALDQKRNVAGNWMCRHRCSIKMPPA